MATTTSVNAAARCCAALLLALAAAPAAEAAGGHFEVDDAVILGVGHCQVEVWAIDHADASRDYHLGPACRVAAVELGLNLDRIGAASGAATSAGPQLKWAFDLWPKRLAAGVVWGAGFDLVRGGAPSQTLYLPITWTAGGRLLVHGNVGIDRVPSDASRRRIGAAAEWTVARPITLIAERLTVLDEWRSRVGARLSVGASTSIDFSIARTGPNAQRLLAIGLNYDLDRFAKARP